jgi:hypothetical protein
LRRCLEKHQETFLSYIKNKAQQWSRRPERNADREKAEGLALSRDAKKNVTAPVADLREMRCDQGDSLVFATEEELALVDVAVPDAGDYLRQIRASLSQLVNDRLTACAGETR